MPQDKRDLPGNNLNDPEQHPADIADHQERTEEAREEEAQTGGQQDDQGHAPKVPGANAQAPKDTD
ncbi:hypothetical protein [Pseudomonas quasicaspiana]|uniref:hypothetical protein n=1 Tax=Pseudomonas quasicaspiana TaxID=2829821 RepID=UPI001E3699DF|nr:hypothetical protein [Pseudomonas quasicaspiana]MCD5973634.1 hypothetical protein [Pseudomonas quasicaspiana]